jgi:ABC-2 type transport system ATP-binding protein
MLELQNVTKRYQNHLAVDQVSFSVPKGCIFGLLGPNGAGKTSLIRIITTITRPDSGRVLLNGYEVDADTPSKIGYMPEERGLYKKMKVGDQLLYLARLKGMDKATAKREIGQWLEKFAIQDWWGKKVEELSKGMQQKIQFIATVLHRPSLLILDEPFSGLDPVNANLIKSEIDEMHNSGTTILFSTHRMEQVEAICERIVLIDKGKNILEGTVRDIKQTYKENKFHLTFEGALPDDSPQFANILLSAPGEATVQVSNEQDSNVFLHHLINNGIFIHSFNEILPSLNEIFINEVSKKD